MMFPLLAKCHRLCLQCWLLALLAVPAQAVILLSGDNSANQTAPDAARTDIFNAVARVCNSTGGLINGYGSAVYLRGKYMLTAHHVNTNGGSHVTFDGVTLYERDTTFTPVQIAPNVDLKLIRLVEDPGLNEVKLFDDAAGDQLVSATIIGVGVGREPNDIDGNTTWVWGSNATMEKRWGENQTVVNVAVSYQSGSYDALVTTLEVTPGNNEAAVTIYDSGCGIFIEDAGEWKLAGIATAVDTGGSSTFDDDAVLSDGNYYTRISTYADQIEAAIAYADWKIGHGLSGGDANDDADTDGDGIPQLLEYALGGDPNVVDLGVLPTQQIFDDSGTHYLELSVTRPIGLQGLNYVPQTTTDLSAWPADSSGILDPSPAPTDNEDGTETLVYRRAAAVSDHESAFIRLRVEFAP